MCMSVSFKVSQDKKLLKHLFLFQDKWIDSLKHLCNQHYAYSHGPLEDLQRTDWFEMDQSDFGALREIILDKRLLQSFKYYTMFM